MSSTNSTAQKQPYRIAVIGAGICGRMMAWRLQTAGLKVELFDNNANQHMSGASAVAAGMLSPYSELEHSDSLVFQLGLQSLSLWPKLVSELDCSNVLNSNGTLLVAHKEDEHLLKHFEHILTHKQREHDITINKLNAHQLANYEPLLAEKFSSALLLPNEASVEPQAILKQLAEKFLAAGGRWHYKQSVTEVTGGNVHVNGRSQPFNWVVDCRGLGAREAIKGLRGVRGELLVLRAKNIPINYQVRLMHPRYQLYLVPRLSSQQLVIGATQIESENESSISVRSALELLSAAYSLHHNFADAEVIASHAQLRPAFTDQLPKICHRDQLTLINGLYRHGILLAPIITQMATQSILRQLNDNPSDEKMVSNTLAEQVEFFNSNKVFAYEH